MANYRVNLMELQSGPDDSFGAFTSLDVVSVGVCVCVYLVKICSQLLWCFNLNNKGSASAARRDAVTTPQC